MNPIERKKEQLLYSANKQNIREVVKKKKLINFKNLVNKIHMLLIKKLKININDHIKTSKNHNLLQV
jgi:hypothetical protein